MTCFKLMMILQKRTGHFCATVENKSVKNHHVKREQLANGQSPLSTNPISKIMFLRKVKNKSCKKAFCVRRLFTFFILTQVPQDKPGQHPKANKTTPEVLRAIHDHILEFPEKEPIIRAKILST